MTPFALDVTVAPARKPEPDKTRSLEPPMWSDPVTVPTVGFTPGDDVPPEDPDPPLVPPLPDGGVDPPPPGGVVPPLPDPPDPPPPPPLPLETIGLI